LAGAAIAAVYKRKRRGEEEADPEDGETGKLVNRITRPLSTKRARKMGSVLIAISPPAGMPG
jgi:hypothetical protein